MMARYSVTTQPEQRLPVPRVQVSGYSRLTSPGNADVIVPTSTDPALVEVPPELYLRALRDLDLGDTDEIVGFCNTYGPLTFDNDVWMLRPLPRGERWEPSAHELRPGDNLNEALLTMADLVDARLTELMHGHPQDEAGVPVDADVSTGLSAPQRPELAILETWVASERARGVRSGSFHADEFRLLVRQLRDMTSVFLAAQGVIDEADVAGAWQSVHWPWPGEIGAALVEAATLLEAGLRWHHLRVVVSANRDRQEPPSRVVPRLYEVLCLQLFNDLSEGAEWRTCQNESCGRAFRRQLGRSRLGQHHLDGDVRYCSPRCAAAQRARSRRSRVAAASRLARNGMTTEQIATEMTLKSNEPVAAGQVARWLAAGAERRKKALDEQA